MAGKKRAKEKTADRKKDGRRDAKKQRRSGPRLPSSLHRELDELNPNPKRTEDDLESDGGGDEVPRGDVYEYEEGIPEEETKKNRRFDPVDNYEYELPSDFQDEDVPSGDEDDSLSDEEGSGKGNDRHSRMLEGITGMPGEAFKGKKRTKVVLSSVTGETATGQVSIQDLLDPLHGKPGYSKLRKRLDQLERKPISVQAPLPKVERDRVERKVAYQQSKKDITKWEPLVKRNREAPTLIFEEDFDLQYSTVGEIASEFKPRTEFEKKMALLVGDPEVEEAHRKDGARLLELNKLSVEDVKERQNYVAKMRSLLFSHEMKSKRLKRIKSKTFHRIAKKHKQKSASVDLQVNPEAAKEYALKQEFKRAEERMTLKHKNSSKWAKRILKRGLDVQDEGTRAAISEQLNQHALLTRKMNSMKDSSSSDESSDDDDIDDELSPETESEGVSKLLNRAKEKSIKLMEDKDEAPKSGVLALPFMERGLKKRQEAAYEEARLALEEYDSALGLLDAEKETKSLNANQASGRKVFGTAAQQSQSTSKRSGEDNIRSSDSEDDFDITDHDMGHEGSYESKNVQDAPSLFNCRPQISKKTVFKNFDDIIKDPHPQTSYEVAIFASDSWKKMKAEDVMDGSTKKSATSKNQQDIKEMDRDSEPESDEEMMDGILSSVPKSDYELPSQADLVLQAFAGDDVEAEFEKGKMEVLNEENPEPEKPVLVPGWGQWTQVQQKKGLPSWIIEEHENAKRKREKALKGRKDAHLNHVIISERSDKKVEKLFMKSIPHPFSSKEVFEQSIRMPIGPEYNPAISVGALNRPAIVKRAGTIIKPIRFEEIDPHAKTEEPRRIVQTADTKKKSKPKARNTNLLQQKLSTKSSGKTKS